MTEQHPDEQGSRPGQGTPCIKGLLISALFAGRPVFLESALPKDDIAW
ncbi:hypothetical protein [Croceibacterium mercuriale]|nr:hypothetical protein [Croceibacterium mercuriale]